MRCQLLILDYGSQYTQLIARAVRELGVYCEILSGTCSLEKIREKKPSAIILSGGPASVRTVGSPRPPVGTFDLGIPILGICYGMQILAVELGGSVEGWGRDVLSSVSAATPHSPTEIYGEVAGEFGPATVTFSAPLGPFAAFAPNEAILAWMSHGDKVVRPPPGFTVTASSPGSPVAAFADESRRFYGVQFHPEVHHTPRGKELLSRFLFDVSKLEPDWNSTNFIAESVARIRREVPHGNVVCALSGGVDSTVAAVLVHRAIGDRLHCLFVDNGLLRQNEPEDVMAAYDGLGLRVRCISARKRFLDELSGVTDPEEKRKIIGRVFIEVFEEEAHRIQDVEYLVQGTLYPDVIESVPVVGKSSVIKSHHNVGGLAETMRLKLIEPLRELFKDEVRKIGRELGIAEHFLMRQPFPGPGLAVRCLGEVTVERLEKLRRADAIVTEEIHRARLETALWQSFAVLLPVRSVGVMGDGRTFDEAIALRMVTSRDGMTADWYLLPEEVLRVISNRIVNETPGVNRVVLDISTKPPSTIEWE